jgi:amino acid transporter
VWGITDPGPGGFNVTSFIPGDAPSAHGLYLGVVFTIFAFAGWEAVAPLAEEARRPHRSVKVAIVAAIVLLGMFMVFSSWGMIIGWGTDRIGVLARSTAFPPFALAHQFWGAAWIVVLAAFVNSVLAVSVACMTASTRMWYAMARSGSLPRRLAYLHRTHQTPVGAVAVQVAIALGVGLGLGFWLGPRDEFLTLGLSSVLSLAFVYAAGNIGVLRYYLVARRSEFNPVLHALFPLATTAALVWTAVKTFVPLPRSPYRYAPIAAGGWLVIGAVLLWVMQRQRRENWFHEAARSVDVA